MSVIEVSNLSKKYLIYHAQQGAYSTLVETLSNKAKEWASFIQHPFDKGQRFCADSYEEFWALKDVDFQVHEGDRIGIIGRNGSGKSTLLKLLSRITEPTKGTVKIKGRVASLLEVGTGFHPELTGHENIYLNGAILGMKRSEIKRQFDEIVAFAEIEKFLDTPVKRYSSGMYTRLGFAIAAHLDPDVLIVDEVLSVGDAQFQQKCLKKLNDLGGTGRTVLFVSHDANAILHLCNKGIYLENGTVKTTGSATECVSAYMQKTRVNTLEWKGDAGDEHIRFYQASLRKSSEENETEFFTRSDKARLLVEYEVLESIPDLVLGFMVFNQRNQQLARAYVNDDQENSYRFFLPGRHRISFCLDSKCFHEGNYMIKLDCVIQNKKRIIGEQIVLQYPISTKKQELYVNNCLEGIHLGHHWAHHGVSNG